MNSQPTVRCIGGPGRALVALVAVCLVAQGSARGNLIANGGFENVPGTGPGFQDQGLLPSGWLHVNAGSADTYSNDGSYGLQPGPPFFNFTGVTAFEGIRWLAGTSIGRLSSPTIGAESFGTVLTAPLVPGVQYRLDAALHLAVRSDLTNPGAYDLYLISSNDAPGEASAAYLGAIPPTTAGSTSWESRSFTFTAPAGAGSRPILVFSPYQVAPPVGYWSYAGIDDVSLNAVPEASSGALMGVGCFSALVCAWRRRRKL